MTMMPRYLPILLRLMLPALLGVCPWAAAAAVPATSPTLAAPAAVTRATTATAATSATQARRDPGFFLSLQPADKVRIGDPVELRLEARDPAFLPGAVSDIRFEPDPEKWQVDAPFRRQLNSTAGKKDGPWLAAVRPFDTGRLLIPPFTVAYRDAVGGTAEALTTTATLNVIPIRSATSKETALLPLRDPAEIPRDWTWLWATLWGLALLGVAFWLGVRWLRRRRAAAAAPPVPELPPGLWALRELDHRSRLPVCQNGPAKAVFSHVSEVIRLYLGRRYGVSAIDMTTLECLQALHAVHPGPEVLRWLREFLEECDLVKFTTSEPPRERWKTVWFDACLIVKMTTPADELGENTATEPAREVAV